MNNQNSWVSLNRKIIKKLRNKNGKQIEKASSVRPLIASGIIVLAAYRRNLGALQWRVSIRKPPSALQAPRRARQRSWISTRRVRKPHEHWSNRRIWKKMAAVFEASSKFFKRLRKGRAKESAKETTKKAAAERSSITFSNIYSKTFSKCSRNVRTAGKCYLAKLLNRENRFQICICSRSLRKSGCQIQVKLFSRRRPSKTTVWPERRVWLFKKLVSSFSLAFLTWLSRLMNTQCFYSKLLNKKFRRSLGCRRLRGAFSNKRISISKTPPLRAVLTSNF